MRLVSTGKEQRRCSPAGLSAAGGVLAHVGVPGLYPDRAMHNTVHDRVSMHVTSEAFMPMLLLILGAEHRRDGVIAALEKLEEHAV